MFRACVIAACVVAAGCRSVDQGTGLVQAEPPDAGNPEVEALRPKLEKLSAQTAQVVQRSDEALWAHWTQGATLDVSGPDGGVTLTRDSLALVRRARELKAVDPRIARHLEYFIVGDLLARGVADENTMIANLEASLTCTVDTKEQRWRELSRQLVNEKSAVKRKALWSACLAPAEQLDAAFNKRDAKVKAVLASLEVTSALDFATESRELDLDALAKVSTRLLDETDALWHETLRELSDNELKLPLEAITRADLPRLLKVPVVVDNAFPKAQVASRAVQTLGTLGLYGRPGLTLDLAEAAKKNPLPLTVAPRSNDVRVSFRPLGGLRDQALVLSELGTALALLSSKTGHFETTRLGDPAITQLSGALFATLLTEDEWLDEMKVPGRAAVRAAAVAQHLFALRRAAGTVLARLELTDVPDATARARFVAIMTRALGVKMTPEDGVRMRLETDDFLRSATALRSMLLAATLREQLGPRWWRKAESGQALLNLWAKGTALPAETTVGPLMLGLTATVPLKAEVASDAGVGAPAVAPKLKTESDGGS